MSILIRHDMAFFGNRVMSNLVKQVRFLNEKLMSHHECVLMTEVFKRSTIISPFMDWEIR